jgi:hypothetical protein
MARYAGDQVANNPTVVANYARTKPSTRFSTRQLQILDIELTGVATNPYAPNSLYSKAVRGIQTAAEIQMLGEPTADHFIVVVAYDTLNDGENTRIGAEQGGVIGDSAYTHGPNDQTGLDNSNLNFTIDDALHNDSEFTKQLQQRIYDATGSSCSVYYKKFKGSGLASGEQFYSDESVYEDC